MTDATAPAFTGFGTKGYRAYVLGALLVVYTFNFIDRVVIGIIGEPIKIEFGLTDLQLGLLGGTAFAILYTLLGIPVHEASHGMMFLSRDPARRKRWNGIIGWACALPFGIHYQRHWAEGHVTHHVHPIEDDDPQAFNRSTGQELARVLALLLLVPGAALVHRFTVKRHTGYGGSSLGVFAAFVTLWSVALPSAAAGIWPLTWRMRVAPVTSIACAYAAPAGCGASEALIGLSFIASSSAGWPAGIVGCPDRRQKSVGAPPSRRRFSTKASISSAIAASMYGFS